MSRHLNLLSIYARRTLLVLLALALLAAPGLAYAQQELNSFPAPGLNWYTVYGGNYQDNANAMATDSSGNIYVVGGTSYGWQNVGMEPLHPFTPRQNGFMNNMVIAKFNASGKLLWHTYYGSSSAYTNGNSILVDASGNVYIVGESNGEWDGLTPKRAFHGPSNDDNGMPNNDVFILKLNSAGAYQWHTYYGSTRFDGRLRGVWESNGNILVAGQSEGAWAGLTPKRPFVGSSDFFALSVDKNGDYRWHTFYGTQAGWLGIEEMQVDPAGDIYLTGQSSVGFYGIQPLRPRDTSAPDILVIKMSKEGEIQWHTFFGGEGYDFGYALVFNGGNVFLTGVSYKPWPGLNPLHPFNDESHNLFVLKLNSAGAYQWHTFYGIASGSDLAVDSLGRIIVAGDASDFLGMRPITPFSGNGDTLLMILDAQGKYASHAYYGTAADEGNGDIYDSASEILLAGNKLYMYGHSGPSWDGFPPLHYGWNDTDVFLASMSITEKSTYATYTYLTLPLNPVEVKTPVTLIADVLSAGGVVNHGTVTFKDGGTVLGTAYVSNGQAKLDITYTVGGRHDLTASYSGVTGFLPSQTTVPGVQYVAKIATALSMTPSGPISIPPGWNKHFEVTLQTVNTSSHNPTGAVVLKMGSMELAREWMDGRTQVLFDVGVLPIGQYEIYAIFEENDLYTGSRSNTATLTVEKIKTDLALVISPLDTNPTSEIRYGSVVQLNTSFGSLDFFPEGTVTLKDGEQTLATQTIFSGATYYATYTLLPGTHTFQAFYSGSNCCTASASALRTVEVLKGDPRIMLSAEGGNPAVGGEERRINITVTGPRPDITLPSGTVTLYEGETEIATLTLVDGVAVSEPIVLSEGAHFFTAVYSGDSLYEIKTSIPSPVIVAGTPIYMPLLMR